MANMIAPKNMQEALALIEQMRKEAEERNSAKVTVKMADYGAGTISLYGINRFPLSVYPSQIATLKAAIPDMEAFAAKYSNELRCAAYAADFAKKSGAKWPSNAKEDDPSVVAYKAKYTEGYAQAMKDATLVSSKAK